MPAAASSQQGEQDDEGEGEAEDEPQVGGEWSVRVRDSNGGLTG